MNELERFIADGPKRTAWLERQLEPVANKLRYYAGPGLSEFGGGVVNALAAISPGADFMDMVKGSGETMNALSRGDAIGTVAGIGGIAAAGAGAFLPGSASSVQRAADDGADAIARLLREGRADEVTDDMLAALGPEGNARLWDLYEQGATGVRMPMDEASRMGRAQEMGHDTNAYHGTGNGGFAAFSKDASRIDGVTYSDISPDVANAYSKYGAVPQVYPVSMRADNPEKYDLMSWEPMREAAVFERSKQDGFDAYYARDGRRIAFDPRNIRSRFARFDPRLKHLANLSAAAPLAIGAGAAAGYALSDEDIAFIRGEAQQ